MKKKFYIVTWSKKWLVEAATANIGEEIARDQLDSYLNCHARPSYGLSARMERISPQEVKTLQITHDGEIIGKKD